MDKTEKVIVIISMIIHYIVPMNNPIRKNIKMFVTVLSVVMFITGILDLDLPTLPINPESSLNPETVREEMIKNHLYFNEGNVGNDKFVIEVFDSEMKLKDIRTNG